MDDFSLLIKYGIMPTIKYVESSLPKMPAICYADDPYWAAWDKWKRDRDTAYYIASKILMLAENKLRLNDKEQKECAKIIHQQVDVLEIKLILESLNS